MADNTLQLAFSADTTALDTAKEKIASLGEGLPSVGNLIKGLGQSFMDLPGTIGLGVAALTAFAAAAAALGESAMASINNLMEMSSATGVSVQNLQVMKTAMSLTGESSDELGEMLNHLNRTVDAAQDPTSRASVAMKMLGISQQELAKGDTAEIMQHVAQVLNQMAPGANKAALEMQIFGKSGADADEAIKSLADNTDRAKQILADHGAVTDEDVQSQKSLNGAITEAKAVFEGIGLAVLRQVVPAITSLAQWFDNVTKISGPLAQTVIALWNGMKELGSAVGELISPIIGAWEATMNMSKGLIQTVQGTSALSQGLSNLRTVFGVVVTAVKVVEVAMVAAEAAVISFAEAVMRVDGALNSLVHGHLSEAAHAFDGFTDQIKKNIQAVKDYSNSEFSNQLETAATSTQKVATSTDTATKSVGSLSAAYKVLEAQHTVNELNAKWAGQKEILAGAIQGLQQYRDAEQDVEIEAEKAMLRQQGASSEQIRAAEIAMRGANAAKQATSEQVAGLNVLSQLQQQYNDLKNHETIIDKANADIANDPRMTEALKQKILAQAQANQEEQNSQSVKKMIADLEGQVTKGIDSETAAMRLSTNQLTLYNKELKLKQQLEKDEQGKPVEVQKQLEAAYQKTVKILEQENQQVQQLQQSWQGFGMGAVQAIQNTANEAQNLYKIGGQLVTQFNTDLANAFIKMAQGGKDAFGELIASIGQMIAQQLLKFAITQAELGILSAFGITGQSAATLLGAAPVKSAKGNAFAGGNVTAFASGGVLDGPQMVPMALMGEAGPEAVMPLSRDSQGRLGVSTGGGSSSSGGGSVVHFHAPSITINSNQPAEQVGQQVRKQLKVHQQATLATIRQQKRPGGALHHSAPMLQ